MASEGSVTRWIRLLKEGDQAAAQPLWEANGHPRMEGYLGEDGGPDALFRDLLILELVYRRGAGEEPAEEEYRQRFPERTEAVTFAFGQAGSAELPTHSHRHGTTGQTVEALSAGPPACTGPRFRILHAHARGNLGEVFVAHDGELNREVALKRIRANRADDPRSRSRFLREAELTGGLEHPGIVPVYSLGRDAEGRPHYAMRLIRGESLGDAIGQFHRADRQDLDPGVRALELRKLLGRFLDVCNAIAYAHGRGVLHRDLKPGNIMLGGYGETLVVDWGLAKALGVRNPAADGAVGEKRWWPSSASDNDQTQPGEMMGTPAFMSPEQTTGQWDRVGPASDVYSLGATLYALLTGRSPFAGTDVDAALERVRRGDFLRPRAIRQDIPRALESICLKAMALRPGDRYASPRALAEDIEHWLADEPVSAYLEPWPVRLGRWGRRHRSLVATAVAILATATVGLAAGLVAVNAEMNRTEQARLAESQQRTLAQTREREARDKEAEARSVLGFVRDKILAAARPEGKEGGLGRAVTLRAALQAALPQVEASFQGRPHVEAAVRMTLGISFSDLGDEATAEQQFQTARARYTAQMGPDHPDTLASMNNLANSYAALGRHAEALKLREETLALRKAKFGPDHPDTLDSMHNLAESYAALGQYAEAVKLHEQTLALQKAKLGPDHPGTLASMNDLALSYFALGRRAEALKLHEETLALRKAKLSPNHPDTLSSMINLANCYGALGRRGEALKLREQTLTLCKAKLGPDHPDTLRSMHNLANSYVALGRHADALKLDEETLALRKAKLGADHPDTLMSMGNLAESLVAVDRPSEAVAIIDDCLRRAEGKIVDPRLAPQVLDLRLRVFAQQKDAASAFRQIHSRGDGFTS